MAEKTYEVVASDDLTSGGSWLTHSVDVTNYWPEDAVTDAIKIFIRDWDGWEWVRDGTRFLVREKGEELAEEYEVSIDHEPVYYANKID